MNLLGYEERNRTNNQSPSQKDIKAEDWIFRLRYQDDDPIC
jgi:hypothetical protein